MNITHTALSGALAAQTALGTASQNIANVMTPGYSRQGALLSSVHLSGAAGISAGNGVKVPSLIRFSDGYKSLQMWQAASDVGQYEAVSSYLTQLEEVMGNQEAGIDVGIDEFFAALNAASVEPSSGPLRQQVIIAANALAQRFNSFSQVLSNQRVATSQQRNSVVAQVNKLTADVAELNKQIASARAGDVSPSGLLDERDRKIDALASLVGIQSVEQPDGTRSVSLRSGQPLVVGAQASTVSLLSNPDGSQTLQLKFANESFTLPDADLGGQLGGLDDFDSRILKPLITSINDTAGGLANRINTQLGAGFALDGSAGKPLFEYDASTGSGMLKVAAGLSGKDLGFSSDPAASGDSRNLLAVIDVKNQPLTVFSTGPVLIGDAYTQLLGKLGMDSQQNAAAYDTAQTVRTQAEESWKSTSGVNTDEEAANLMQYQQMYQANMKVIAVANQLFETTLSMFG